MSFGEYFRHARMLGFSASKVLLVLSLHVAGVAFESAGLATMLPVFQFIQASGNTAALVAEYSYWSYILAGMSAVGLPLGLPSLLAVALALVVARQATVFLRLVVVAHLRYGLLRDLRLHAFQRCLAANLGYLDRHLTGSIVSDLTIDLQRAVECVFISIFLVGTIALGLVYVGVLIAMSPAMVLGSLVAFLLLMGLFNRLFAHSTAIGRTLTETNQSMSAFLIERLHFARLIRLSQTESLELKIMTQISQRQRDSYFGIARLLAQLEVMFEPLVAAAICVFLYLGVTRFNLRIEEIGLFLVIVLRLVPVAKELLRTRQSIRTNVGAVEAVVQRLEDLDLNAEHLGGGTEFAGIKQSIELRDASFVYGGREKAVPALNGVSVCIAANDFVAIVGPSGSGKSTLIDLLPRLREPATGEVLIDGQNIRKFDLASLRSRIAYVPQSPQLFDVTISEHIRFGDPTATDGDVRKAAELAGAAAFIDALPESYATRLGEAGTLLSGGQRQRLDLARALVRKSSLLILDEPTSNLDAESEEHFRRTLARIRQQRETTIILIGHRLATVATADSIIVLEQGRVTAVGTHADLVVGKSWYASAWAKQQTGS
jgi:subfamily B ATP-binding cassette protein MsbA